MIATLSSDGAHSDDNGIVYFFNFFVVCLLFYKFCFLVRCDGNIEFPELYCYLC